MSANLKAQSELFPRRQLVQQFDWSNIFCILILHAGTVVALWHFSWSGLAWAVFFMWFIAGLGICLGYHRLLTHHAFKTYKPIEYALTIIGSMSWEGGPIRWVGHHRTHHAFTDEMPDPHTPRQGLFWSHVFWTFWKDPPGVDFRDFAKDMARDKYHQFIERYHRIFNVFTVIGLALLAYLFHADPVSWVLWGVCVRGAVILEVTWLVNSVGHYWGYQNYRTNDDSRNNPIVALLTFGEGWHNNHHACQQSARHGVRWFEIDPTYITICLLEKLGLIWDVQEFKSPSIKSMSEVKI